MAEVQIAPACSVSEAEGALALATRVFSPQSRVTGYAEYKHMLWKEDPTYEIRNLMLARVGARAWRAGGDFDFAVR